MAHVQSRRAERPFLTVARIKTSNVTALRRICSVKLGSDVGFEAGPIVAGGVLYVTTIHATYALNAATCAPRWMRPTGYPKDSGLANRGAAYANGRIFRGTLGNHVIAMNAADGRVLWDRTVAAAPAYVTAAPMVWRNVLFIGTAGADNGGKGAMFALEQTTGRILWQTAMVPADPLSGTLSLSSGWGGASHVAGGSTWSSYTLDTFRGLLLVSTGNPAPDFFGDAREGADASTDSLLVMSAFSGKILEQHALVPHDVHDYDIAASSAYFPTTGTAFVAGKDGLLRSVRLGRTAPTWTTKVTTVDDEPAVPKPGVPVHFCPGTTGGVEWNGPALSAAHDTVFVNSVDWCNTLTLAADVTAADVTNGASSKSPVFYIPGAPWTGAIDYAAPRPSAPFGVPDAARFGHVTAVQATTGQRRWQFDAPAPMLAGITPTAGGIVFTADLAGTFYAFDSASGAILKRIALGEPTAGGVITYGVGNKQYVAVAAGMTSPQVWKTAGTNSIVVLGL